MDRGLHVLGEREDLVFGVAGAPIRAVASSAWVFILAQKILSPMTTQRSSKALSTYGWKMFGASATESRG